MECIFGPYLKGCSSSKSRIIKISSTRLETVKKKSIKRKDNFNKKLEGLSKSEKDDLCCHENCISTYTSEFHINRHLFEESSANDAAGPSSAKRSRRSSTAQFQWKTNCLFCGEVCIVEKDDRHRDRWREAYLCRTADRTKIGREDYKKILLQVCAQRNDQWGDEVRTRLSDVLTDLHAADARYHESCRKSFTNTRNVEFAQGKEKEIIDEAYNKVVQLVRLGSKTKIWKSTELHEQYTKFGGVKLSRRRLMQKLNETLNDDFLMISSSGYVSRIMLKSLASSLLGIDESATAVESDGIELNEAVKKVSSSIVSEIKEMDKNMDSYRSRINIQIAKEKVSSTLSELLSQISPKKLTEESLPSLLIGNMITSLVQNKFTDLLLDLGVMVKNKATVQHLADYCVVASYDELIRFRTCAAAQANEEKSNGVLRHCSTGLVQAVSDNFDCNISSVNGQKQTHSLALIMVQSGTEDIGDDNGETIPRLKKGSLKSAELKDVQIVKYEGPKKPTMPDTEAVQRNSTPEIVSKGETSAKIAAERDIHFFNEITHTPRTPEYSGFNTRLGRVTGQAQQDASVCMYTPLIDLKPAEHSSILTVLLEAISKTEETGQQYTIITFDQQLYKILIDIKWVYPQRFSKVIPRLGGMHLLMSFLGCIGTLMANSGLDDVLKSAFGGVEKMLLGKFFPENVRALRMVVEELLRPYISDIHDNNDMNKFLEDISQKSKTAKLWVDNLVKPMFYAMMFIRAEREGDWPLHLHVVTKMLPYFFAAGHHHYARYATYYLNDMKNLPPKVLEQFMRGEHTTRHIKGYWNGIWSDMFIETTFMRYGKGPSGLIGLTLKPRSVKIWAYSLHASVVLLDDLDNMRERQKCPAKLHKEEMAARITTDGQDREKIRKKLEQCINPFHTANHPPELVNVASGKINCDKNVNVEEAVALGKLQLKYFCEKLPAGFHGTLVGEVKVKVMLSDKKGMKIGDVTVYDTEAIYARIIGLLATGQTTLDAVLKHELAPFPPSMFSKEGDMLIATQKHVLKDKLQVEVSYRSLQDTSASIVDGCAILWILEWPENSTVENIAENMFKYITDILFSEDVYLVFDRYRKYSIKGATRAQRAKDIAYRHQLSLQAVLPSKEKVLTCTHNKVQLIDIITEYITVKIHEGGFRHTFVVTSSQDVPVEVSAGSITLKEEYRTTHEEADIILVQQCYKLLSDVAHCRLKIISDDTDVFALACYFFPVDQKEAYVYMEPTVKGRSIIDIGATVRKHPTKIKNILPAHAISGCDSVCKFMGIGKAKALAAMDKKTLNHLGNLDASIEDVVSEATEFVGLCYNMTKGKDMTEKRYHAWFKKTSGKLSSAPKLSSLPPTNESFTQNVLRAHGQCAIWYSTPNPDPPVMDETLFGFKKDVTNESLVPVTLPPNVPALPTEVQKMMACGCSADEPCSKGACSCKKVQLGCTEFCKCYGPCRNPYTSHDNAGEDYCDDTDCNDDEELM